MASQPPVRFDPFRLLAALSSHGVEYVLVGGLAARLRGSPLVTRDVDITPETSPANLGRLAAALNALRPAEIVPARRRPVPQVVTAAQLGRTGLRSYLTDAGRVDVIPLLPHGGDHAALLPGASRVDLGDGVVVVVAGLDDIIASKEAAGRPKDLADLARLYELREVLRERG